MRDSLPVADTTICARPALSRIPTKYVVNAAFEHLVRWIDADIQPPTAPRIEVTAPPVKVRRDAYGNALGGIQLPQHAVPTATNTGANSGDGFCFLFGSHQPFDQATLQSLYRNHGAYVNQVVRKTNENRAAGYILAPDAVEIKEAAAQSDIGHWRR
ncbi:MAG: hypothetical protein C4519_16940 [Desulfobacteraceae bacterium]|nr:MAG: hypothetical protein C4519_16940 [Desulfobacteraceae bacterium]